MRLGVSPTLIGDGIQSLPCGHNLHKVCYENVFGSFLRWRCPTCGVQFDPLIVDGKTVSLQRKSQIEAFTSIENANRPSGTFFGVETDLTGLEDILTDAWAAYSSTGLQWSLDQVLPWLASNGYPYYWQKTFNKQALYGPGNFAFTVHSLMDSDFYSHLAKRCNESGNTYDPVKERKEGARLLFLIRDVLDEHTGKLLRKAQTDSSVSSDIDDTSNRSRVERKLVAETIRSRDGSKTDVVGRCSICMDDITHGTYMRALSCQHMFHETCSAAMQGNKAGECPVW